MRGRWRRAGRALAAAAPTFVAAAPAWAQARSPFGVGISEGGGSASGLTGWLLNQQAVFERQLSAAVRAVAGDGHALWWLVTLSFVYGVFHAAGPGHGKAVMASYLFANERALKRGMVLSLLAALLQGMVAVALVGVLALALHATALRMKDAASLVESLSYAGIAVLGAWLVWRKGAALWAELRAGPRLPFAMARAAPLAAVGATGSGLDAGAPLRFAPVDGAARAAAPRREEARAYAFAAGCGCPAPGDYAADGGHGAGCGHVHAPDPRRLGEGFSWREAVLTVVAAGSRPCSGAILVLVFALTQGLFGAGILAVGAMSLGTAITTGALAALAVLAKGLAVRLTRPGSRRGTLVLRSLELGAAAVVLLAGLSLFLGYASLGGA